MIEPVLRRPTRPGSFDVFARSVKVEQEWNEFCNQMVGECQRVYDQLATAPDRNDGDRQQPLKGTTGVGTFEGATYARWQIDVTSGGRVWYFIDEQSYGSGKKRRAGRVVIDRVFPGHPKSTEHKPAGKRRPGRR